jgi:hypothetical protein
MLLIGITVDSAAILSMNEDRKGDHSFLVARVRLLSEEG